MEGTSISDPIATRNAVRAEAILAHKHGVARH